MTAYNLVLRDRDGREVRGKGVPAADTTKVMEAMRREAQRLSFVRPWYEERKKINVK